jgi:hypothetical protein
MKPSTKPQIKSRKIKAMGIKRIKAAPPASNRNIFISRIRLCKYTIQDANKKAERNVPL